MWRNLWKNSKLNAINIFGLSISLAICALIGLYLHFDLTFDKSMAGYAGNYRLLTTFKYPNSAESITALSSVMMGPYLQRESHDIVNYLRVISGEKDFICRAGEREIAIGKSLQVDSTFLTFFNQSVLYGSKNDLFSKPENIVLTEPVVDRLFGQINPVGRTIEYTYNLSTGVDTTILYMISGVLKPPPANSHLQFDALTVIDDAQYESWDKSNRWHGVVANTYFKLRSGAESSKVQGQFSLILDREMPGSEMIGLSLQPFSEIHLGSVGLTYDENNYLKSDRKYLLILSSIAFFILLISGINFANLSTVLAIKRTQEVGIRRVLGAESKDVFWQFLRESLAMSLFAGCLGLIMVELLRRPFLALLGRDLNLALPPTVLLYFSAVVVVLGIISGIYPSIKASSSSASKILRGAKTSVSMRRPFVRRLVILQFILSAILMIGSMICYQQIKFLKDKDLGFQYTQVLELQIGENNWMHSPAIKKELAQIPGIVSVSSSDHSLGTMDDQNGVMVRDPQTRQWLNFPMTIIRADYNYFDLYKMEFATGNAPTPVGAENELEYVVNESFVKKVGWKEDPVGQEIMRAGLPDNMVGRVVGVIRDVHHNTLRNGIDPICIQASTVSSIVSLRFENTNISHLLSRLQEVWTKYVKDKPFAYRFMDDHFADLYKNETRLGQALLLATCLSIFIACLGLLALSSFIIGQRTKEIGVRKVLGASILSLLMLLSKDFLKLVIIAFLIACPLAYWMMTLWLQDFAYHVEIGWGLFLLAGITAIFIALVTVAFQSLQSVLADPINSLRIE